MRVEVKPLPKQAKKVESPSGSIMKLHVSVINDFYLLEYIFFVSRFFKNESCILFGFEYCYIWTSK